MFANFLRKLHSATATVTNNTTVILAVIILIRLFNEIMPAMSTTYHNAGYLLQFRKN